MDCNNMSPVLVKEGFSEKKEKCIIWYNFKENNYEKLG